MKQIGIVFLLFIFGCTVKTAEEPENSPFEAGRVVGKIDEGALYESSGLESSAIYPGYLWTHNDSGDEARLFLIDSVGHVDFAVYLDGAKNVDWEDIARGHGPVPGKNYLYVGDIGDNLARRKFKVIYRLEEPVAANERPVHVDSFDSIQFVLEDGSRDTEALFVDPKTNDIYIFSKRESRINAYRLSYPQSTTTMDTARMVVSQMPFTSVTSADISSSADEILIRNYSSIFYWKRKAHETIAETLKHSPLKLPYIPEPQGEAVAFNLKATGYFTTSEVSKGEKVKIKFYQRAKSATP